MRPVKLVIEGVNSFTDAQTLDFTAVGRSNLFCICGNTGAGKSTIFDSIMLALYGRSSRGYLPDIVNLSRMTASVSFTFCEGGEEYRIDRTIKLRRAKAGTGKPADERQLAGTECVLYKNGEPVANTSDEVASLVDRIIGLDESEFKNVYLLEQGEYADFLKKSPAKQAEAVGKIFSLMRFGDVYHSAKARLAEESAAVASAEARIRDLGEVSEDAVRTARGELSVLRAKNTALCKDIEQKRIDLDRLSAARDAYISASEKERAVKLATDRLTEAERAEREAKSALDAFAAECTGEDKEKLAAVRAKLNELAEKAALDTEYSETKKLLEQKTALAEQKRYGASAARARAGELEKKLESDENAFLSAAGEFAAAAGALDSPSGSAQAAVSALSQGGAAERAAAVPEVIFSLRAEKTAYDALVSERAEAEKRIEAGRAETSALIEKIERYTAELQSLALEKERADGEEKAAAEALAKARLGSSAAAIRAELAAGDACPVCGGVYDGHVHGGDTDVKNAAAIHDGAVEKAKEAGEALSVMEKYADKAKGDYERAHTALDAAEKKLKELDAGIKSSGVQPDIYREMSAALGRAKKLAEAFTASEAELLRARPALAAAEAEADGAERAAKEAAARLESLAERLGNSLGKTAQAIAEAKTAEAELEAKVTGTEQRLGKLTAEAEAAKAAANALRIGLNEAISACPVDMPRFDEEEYDNQKAIFDSLVRQKSERETEIAVKDEQLRSLVERLEKFKAIDAERQDRAARADRYATIAELTKSKAMLSYVATEYIEDFTATASDMLAELSRGKYNISFDADAGFVITDYTNSGKQRKTDTLSGGEMFLASLSVAIAIARAVGRGNTAFFFLDEGFGTLDDQFIDTVYSALESLSRDCLVGVISHAEALIDRMPARVDVREATDTSGSRIEY